MVLIVDLIDNLRILPRRIIRSYVSSITRKSFRYQATNEIVQNLVQNDYIERDTVELIKLTKKGLDECKEDSLMMARQW